jgi:hypothetical protein
VGGNNNGNFGGSIMASFESIAVMPGDDETDEVWVSVARTINGSTVRTIERFKARNFSTASAAWFVDCGANSATSLTHLVGETVNILADGVKQPQQTVTAAGAVDDTEFSGATTLAIGLPVEYKLQPMKVNVSSLAFIPIKNIVALIIDVYQSGDGKFGRDSNNLDKIPYVYSTYDSSPTLKTGVVSLPFDGKYDDAGDVLIQDDGPLPFTILAMGMKMGAEIV